MPDLGEAALLHERQLTLEECLPPDFDFLDEYRALAESLIVWDENHQTIQGKSPRQYMVDGLIEELEEATNGEDRVEPQYQRMGALMLLPDLAGNEGLRPGIVTSTAVERHVKEFGDVSWYLANLLTCYDFTYEKVMQAGILGWQLDVASEPRADIESSDYVERNYPWFKFFGYSHELLSAARAVQNVRYDERIGPERNLIIAAGKFTLSMIHITKNRFNLDYADILAGNKSKIEQRTTDGTIFAKEGGDDR